MTQIFLVKKRMMIWHITKGKGKEKQDEKQEDDKEEKEGERRDDLPAFVGDDEELARSRNYDLAGPMNNNLFTIQINDDGFGGDENAENKNKNDDELPENPNPGNV